MRGIGRADDFAGWSTGLRDSGDVGFALLGGEFGEVGDVAVPLAGTHPEAGAGDIEIGLNEHGGGCGGGAGGGAGRGGLRRMPDVAARARTTPAIPQRR